MAENITSNIPSIEKNILRIMKQIPFATSKTLNITAKGAANDITSSLIQRFAPARLNYFKTASGNQLPFKITYSKKTDLQVSIRLREDGPSKGSYYEKVLGHHFLGGNRETKRFEKAMYYNTGLKQGVVASGANRDRYGNLTGAFYTQLMSYLKLHYKSGYVGNMTPKKMKKIERRKKVSFGRGKQKREYMVFRGKKYFIATGYGNTAHLYPGIYSATGIHGSDIKPIMIFPKDQPNYRKRIDFHDHIKEYFGRHFNKNFSKEFVNAIKTAK